MDYKAKGYEVKQQCGRQIVTNWWVRKYDREKWIRKCGRNYKVQENSKWYGRNMLPYSSIASCVIYFYSCWKMSAFMYSVKYLPVEMYNDKPVLHK